MSTMGVQAHMFPVRHSPTTAAQGLFPAHHRSSSQDATVVTSVSGYVSAYLMKFPAQVTLTDASGQRVSTMTDRHGHFQVNLKDVTFPLAAAANEFNANCSSSDSPRGICMGSLWVADSDQTPRRIQLNINPLTDKILSEVARHGDYMGAQDVADQPDSVAQLDTSAITNSENYITESFQTAYSQLGLPADFDPIKYQPQWQWQFSKLVQMLMFNRNYDTHTGQISSTTLMDRLYHPLDERTVDNEVRHFDFVDFRNQLRAVEHARTRVWVLGDSTASIYPEKAYPRAGWGQVFHEQFVYSPAVRVIDAAQSGRSSRSFYNQGWFRYMKSMMRPGDYLLIQMGHNDEKCEDSSTGRGQYDVRNTCTYPNDSNGQPQFPAGRPDMSFAFSLERYIHYAQLHLIHPILLTPTTRAKDADGTTGGFPVVHTHYTEQDEGNNYAYVGDYSQTVRDTAHANHIPVLELEDATINFINSVGDDWTSYWLSVDPAQYPYYEDRTGNLDNPDSTHFQIRGAREVAGIVSNLIKQQPSLRPLAHYLK